jgi:nitrate/nitrite transporter NarK
VLSSLQVVLWTVFVLTLGALSVAGLYALLFAMGLAGASFVLVWPIGREVNPPHLDGVAVAVVNFGGFLGAALTQGPLGALLDAQWAGALVDGVPAIQCRRTAPGSPCARRWWPGPPCSAC